MKLISQIRQLYIPVQPTVQPYGENVIYREFLPAEELQPFIYCYWELKTVRPLYATFIYRVVADGCIDIFFDLDNPELNFVMGFCKKYTEFPLNNTFNFVGIRFLPTMFPQFFNVNASDLSDKYEQLQLVVPSVSDFIIHNFSNNIDSQKICNLFNQYFIYLINRENFEFDNRLYSALNIILQKFGVLNVEKGLDTGISPRQLRRLFEFYVGTTPKTFSKVVRFQNILRAKPSRQSLKQNKLFFDVGYYDQAHFIKEFKNFYGVTPSKAFGR